MDMIRDDSWHAGLHQHEEFAWGTLENRLYLHAVDHLMDNFSLRPTAGMRMESPATSRDLGWRGAATVPLGSHTLRVGIDLHHAELDAEQVAVASGARRDTFNASQRKRIGAYLDWEHELDPQWTTRLGLRGDRVASDADPVANAIMPANPALAADQARFNAADRSRDELLPAVVAALRFTPDATTTVELAAALKSRAPSLVERYLWTPLNASAGLADGRTYLGNLALDPETAIEVALALTKRTANLNLSLTPFYQSVADYIQGVPIARADSNGRPVLEYRNTGRAKLYGCEAAAGHQFTDEFSVEASASCVRGRNRDTGGDLYRIAPLHGVVDLGYQRAGWDAHLECVWAADQNRVAAAQGESATPGYGLLNLRLARTFAGSVRVEAGVENVLGRRYADHLGGVNRVAASDVAVGSRIPGAARFAYLAVEWKF
jgi:iron complex outermembrane recepter protein